MSEMQQPVVGQTESAEGREVKISKAQLDAMIEAGATISPLPASTPWKSILGKIITCVDCSLKFTRTGPSQQFCPLCSEERSRARKLKWATKNPPPKDAVQRYSKQKRERRSLAGVNRSIASRRALGDVFQIPIEQMQWFREVQVPFLYAGSKNHMSAMSNRGHVFMRKESREYKQAIALDVAKAVAGVNAQINKVWIWLLIQKPNHRGDAVNLLDLVIDSIKHAVGVDDRWFSIGGVDWEVIKREPMIHIGVGQFDTTPSRVCSYCGLLLPLAEFVKNKGGTDGYSRSCFQCHRDSQSERSRNRRHSAGER